MAALERMAVTEAHAARGDLLVVPLGATEQHGPHLPLATDTTIAAALAAHLAARRAGVTVAPALPYGASGEHQGFAGTISIGASALETVVVELGRSATETFHRVLLLNAHGGNAEALARAVARLRDEGRDVHSWSPAQSFAGDAHAGHVETSVMLALAPDVVATEHAVPGNRAPLRELMPRLRAAGVHAVSPSGVLGDPTTATADDGASLLARAVQALCSFVDRWPDA